jgi:hypothetical protein
VGGEEKRGGGGGRGKRKEEYKGRMKWAGQRVGVHKSERERVIVKGVRNETDTNRGARGKARARTIICCLNALKWAPRFDICSDLARVIFRFGGIVVILTQLCV